MKCPKCGSPMTLLFIHWVCDTCDGKNQPTERDADDPCDCGKPSSSCGSCSSGCVSSSSKWPKGFIITPNNIGGFSPLPPTGPASPVPPANGVANYYNGLVPPPPSSSDWWMNYWPSAISMPPPTASDGLRALQNPARLFTCTPKMTLLVEQDSTDPSVCVVKVLTCEAPSMVGTMGVEKKADVDMFEAYFPTFMGPVNAFNPNNDPPMIWIFP